MPCPHFTGTGCGGCRFFVKSTAVAVVGATLQITIPATTLVNGQPICICIAQALPLTVTPAMTVTVLNGATLMQVRTRCGNFIRGDQICSRTVLHFTAATDTATLVLSNTKCLRCACRTFPVINPPVVVAPVALDDSDPVAPLEARSAKKV